MGLKVGVTSGIYYAARDVEIHSAIRKLGYTLTRGTSAMEIAGDVAHEINYTDGERMRHIARKQGVELTFHGDLTVPICIPERGEWRDAHDRIIKSLRSGVFMGAKYVNFHSCLNIWLELITYAGRKLTMAFCNEDGEFISEILHKCKETRDWFIKKKGDLYLNDILDREENVQISTLISVRQEKWRKDETDECIRKELGKEKGHIEKILKDEALIRLARSDQLVAALLKNPNIINDPKLGQDEKRALIAAQNRINNIDVNVDDFIDNEVETALLRGIPRKTGDSKIDTIIEKVYDDLRKKTVIENSKIRDNVVNEFLEKKLSSKDKKKRRWYSEELRAVVGIVDGYHIMAHYLYWTQDPLWVAMTKEYKQVLKEYDYKKYDPDWLDEAWIKAEDSNDRLYKEFFYAAVGAKYLEGHMKSALNWLHGDFIKKEIPKLTRNREKREELAKIARNMIIAIENPDAREPAHAGLYFLFRPKQIYAAIKTLRKTLNTDKVMMLIDHEHLATQGIDALLESRSDILSKPDFGEITISVHSNHPNPLHAHYPVELGDVTLYELLYNLRATGFGVKRKGYLIFERGGGQDPFVHSVDSLKLMAKFLQTEPPTCVKKLPLEFFGMKGMTAGDIVRQVQIIKDHAWDPMKDLLEIPEEEWSLLSQSAIKKGKRPEVWKRGEVR